ncbi:MAG: hypothetical protein EOO38_25915 [Cytophagaceae bacterium]|nr:MAG: hypothetical protein EOO38_25915 [Cytophagaceae bacterium]
MEPDERPAPTVWCLPSDVFLGMEFPPREILLAPWLVGSSINMLTAYRGTGKTWAALSIATAVASAGQFLTFEAPAAKQVLYIDGEMPFFLLSHCFRLCLENDDVF